MIGIQNLFLKKKIPEISDLNLKVKAGETFVLLSSGERVSNHLMNIFSGRERGYSGTVQVDRRNILDNSAGSGPDLVYIGKGNDWPPTIRIKDIMGLLRRVTRIPEEEYEEFKIKMNLNRLNRYRLNDLEEVEKRRLLFSIVQLSKCSNYVIQDLAKGMPIDFILEFKENLRHLKRGGCSILYISDDVFFAPEIGDRIGFLKKGKLLLELKGIKVKRMDLKELYFKFLAEE
jgi:ABC-type multidrug transport system ATPase subunit